MDRRAPRPPPTPARRGLRRPGVRLALAPPRTGGARHRARSRAPRRRPRERAGDEALGRRADVRLAPSIPPTESAIRAARRPARGTTPSRLRPHLLAHARRLILKGALTRIGS